VHTLVGGHPGRRIHVALIRGPCFGALRQRKDEHGPEAACQKAQRSGPQGRSVRRADVGTQKVEPMLLMTGFGISKRQQNLAIGTGAPLREIAIDRCLSAFVCQMLAPPTQIRTRGI
jgi:hypothetical protein